MNEEECIVQCCDNMEKLKKFCLEKSKNIIEQFGGLIDSHLFVFSLIKRTLDIIDTFSYATKTFNINTQIPLLRLQVDNCMIIRGVLLQKEKGNDIYKDTLCPDFDVKKFTDLEGKSLSDNKLAKLVNEDYKHFFELYKFCCKFVHFTGKAFNTLIFGFENRKMQFYLRVGNQNKINDVITNSNDMVEVTKVLFHYIEKYLNIIKGDLLSEYNKN